VVANLTGMILAFDAAGPFLPGLDCRQIGRKRCLGIHHDILSRG